MFDAIAYTQWRDCEGNVVCNEEDRVTVSLKSGEVIHGEIVGLNGNTMSLESEILGDLEIDMEFITDLEVN